MTKLDQLFDIDEDDTPLTELSQISEFPEGSKKRNRPLSPDETRGGKKRNVRPSIYQTVKADLSFDRRSKITPRTRRTGPLLLLPAYRRRFVEMLVIFLGTHHNRLNFSGPGDCERTRCQASLEQEAKIARLYVQSKLKLGQDYQV